MRNCIVLLLAGRKSLGNRSLTQSKVEPTVRYLIVNGDDFGLSPGVSRGILEAHASGILTSASFMVDRPAAAMAAELARRASGLSLGLHLELESPTAGDVGAMVEAQLRGFERLIGRPPAHLDSHQDRHLEPHALAPVLRIAATLGIPVRGRSPVTPLREFYGRWGGEDHPEQVGVESLLRLLETKVGRGVTELICHPGYVDADLDSSYATVRETELETLCAPQVREALNRGGIRLIGFRELPQLLGDPSEMRSS